MPYDNVPESEWGKMDRCVKRIMKTGKSKPSAIAICHNSVVGKSLTDEETEAQDEETKLAQKGWVPYGVKSFTELRALRKAEELAHEIYELSDDFVGLVNSIMMDDSIPVSQKGALIQRLASEYETLVAGGGDPDSTNEDKELDESLITRVVGKVKEFLGLEEPSNQGLLIWKEKSGDRYLWLARYSNNFRDDDNPPEIISEQSHINFVKGVDEGKYPLPELWLWHRPEWKIGQATEVAYDDSGFAIAAGYFDKEKEDIAEWLSKQKGVLVSHGMPPSSIVRDEKDPSIIVEHQTFEISPLPAWAAANKITGFVVLDASNEDKENKMIAENKRKALIEHWKIDPALLDRLEQQNVQDAQQAVANGRESKEVSTETVEETVTATETVETVQETTTAVETVETTETTSTETPVAPEETAVSVTPTADFPTRQEVAEAFGAVLGEMKGQIETLAASLEQLTKELNDVKGIKTEENEIVKEAVANVPAASLAALLASTVVGHADAAIDRRSTLAKSKPKEAETETESTGIPFIDRMLSTAR